MKMTHKLPLTAAILASSLCSMTAQAEMFWSDNSISLLYGEKYKVTDETLTTMTLEHVSGHSWGDVFFFLDRHNGEETDYKETYSELSPRLSFGKLSGSDLSIGPMKDVLLAGTYEYGSFSTGNSKGPFAPTDGTYFASGQDNYLTGFGFDWDVPGLAYFQTNFYYANNENTEDDQQLTVVYGAPFSIGSLDITFDGYIDWSTGESDHKSDFHFNPQLRADVGKYIGITKSKLEIGTEYSYWHNKFGTDEEESVFSALVKFHL